MGTQFFVKHGEYLVLTRVDFKYYNNEKGGKMLCI